MNCKTNSFRFMALLMCLLCLNGSAFGSNKEKKKKKKGKAAAVVTDTAKANAPKGIPSLDKFITPAAKAHKGMVNIYEQNNKYFMEIPQKLMGRDIFVFVSLIKGSAQEKRGTNDFKGYGGDDVYSKTIRFAKGPKDKVFIHEPIFSLIPQNFDLN